MKKHVLFTMSVFLFFNTNVSAFPLEESTIATTEQALQSQQISCEALAKFFWRRIQQYDLSTASNNPPINAFNAINPYLFDQARALDEYQKKTGKLKGPLHCIPIVVKDNMDTYDNTTTMGSFSLLGNQPNRDAFLVEKLRAAGAIIIGKGAMDEFASGLSGISSRNGRIGNVYDTTQNPGGSSGGSATAVSANFAMLGIGSDNSGSVRVPAAFNGLIGLRPSMGLISQRNMFPLGGLDGTAGPLARTVTDVAKLLTVIAQADPQDPQTLHHPIQDYQTFLQSNALQGKRIGVVHFVGKHDVWKAMPENMQTLFARSIHHFQQLGATIIDPINLPNFDNDRTENMAGGVEAVDAYLQGYPSVRKSFEDICLSNRTRTFAASPNACLKFLQGIPSAKNGEYQKALARFQKNKNYFTSVMVAYCNNRSGYL